MDDCVRSPRARRVPPSRMQGGYGKPSMTAKRRDEYPTRAHTYTYDIIARHKVRIPRFTILTACSGPCGGRAPPTWAAKRGASRDDHQSEGRHMGPTATNILTSSASVILFPSFGAGESLSLLFRKDPLLGSERPLRGDIEPPLGAGADMARSPIPLPFYRRDALCLRVNFCCPIRAPSPR